MQGQKIQMSRKQFRIGDLAKVLKVKKFVVRFWEKEFGIKSDRNDGGQRSYTTEDLKTFTVIKDLLYQQGFTIAGAKKQLHAILKGTGPVLMDDIFEQHFNTNTTVEDNHADNKTMINQWSETDTESDKADSENDDALGEFLVESSQTNNHQEETVTPATITSCDCQTVLKKLQNVKQKLLELKAQLKQS